MEISINRQFIAALGEGTLFTDLEEQWSSKFAAMKHQADIVKQTGQMQSVETLTVAPETVILTIA